MTYGFERIALMGRGTYMRKNNMQWLVNPKSGKPFQSSDGYDTMYQKEGDVYNLFLKHQGQFLKIAKVTVVDKVIQMTDVFIPRAVAVKRIRSLFSEVIKPDFDMDDVKGYENSFINWEGHLVSRPKGWDKAKENEIAETLM